MSTPQNPNDPSSAPTEKVPAKGDAGADAPVEHKRHGLSEQTQKALLWVTSGVALVLSIIALVLAISAGDGHHGRGGDGHGPMGGGPRMEHRGGPMGGPQGMVPQGGYSDQAPGQPGGRPDQQGQQDNGTTTTTPNRN